MQVLRCGCSFCSLVRREDQVSSNVAALVRELIASMKRAQAATLCRI
jgi:hypothetical protein